MSGYGPEQRFADLSRERVLISTKLKGETPR